VQDFAANQKLPREGLRETIRMIPRKDNNPLQIERIPTKKRPIKMTVRNINVFMVIDF